MRIFHISDIHFSASESEKVFSMAERLAEDMGKSSKDDYLVISGDLVWSGDNQEDFSKFEEVVLDRFVSISGISRDRIVLCPGNHDADSSAIGYGSKKLLYGNDLDKSEFEKVYSDEREYFETIFSNFNRLSPGVGRVGANYYYDFDRVSFLCLNTAVLTVGGNSKLGSDDRRMVFQSEGILHWLESRKSKTICLVMHHPISWIKQEWRDFIEAVIKAHVDYVFHGHEHKKDLAYRYDDNGGARIFSAPALFSEDADRLGYCCVHLEAESKALYRQWSPADRRFVVGVDFSGNDEGVIELGARSVGDEEFIRRLYLRNLNEALRLFSGPDVGWVERRLSSVPEHVVPDYGNDRKYFDYEDILSGSNDVCILSPPEYGLTSFGRYLCLKALDQGMLGYQLCLKAQRPFAKEFLSRVVSELDVVGRSIEDLDFIVVDSWSDDTLKDKSRAISEVRKAFPKVRLIVMQTCTVAAAGIVSDLDSELRSSGIDQSYYLCALTRDAVRKGVTSYSSNRDFASRGEDYLVSRIIENFDFLNLPRTPLNCFTLLKIMESGAHDSMMNRGDMVSHILALVFTSIELPSYSSVPDAKDCEYIIGFFCADIIRSRKDVFERKYFIDYCNEVCKKKLFDIDVSVMFEILHRNRIIVSSEGGYRFRFFYWVNYFAAMNMSHDDGFRDYVLSSGGYISHPEIIEFYTGSDRKRGDALQAIKRDIEDAVSHLKETVSAEGLFPYDSMKWLMSDSQQARLSEILDQEVSASRLPTEVKDEYSDRTYDPAKPYYQSVSEVLGITSMKSLLNLVKASGKALRNSDFADVELRLSLMESMVEALVQINRVLVLISAFLARSGRASFGDAGFKLVGDNWKEGFVDRQYQIIRAAPENLVNWYSADIVSEKMGPLIAEAVRSDYGLRTMYLVCMVAINRPAGWRKIIEDYISREDKESFGLWAVFSILTTQHRYGFHDESTAAQLAHLAKMCVAKHQGAKKLGRGKIKKMRAEFLHKE